MGDILVVLGAVIVTVLVFWILHDKGEPSQMTFKVSNCQRCKTVRPVVDMEDVGPTVDIVLSRPSWWNSYLVCADCFKKLREKVLDFLEDD